MTRFLIVRASDRRGRSSPERGRARSGSRFRGRPERRRMGVTSRALARATVSFVATRADLGAPGGGSRAGSRRGALALDLCGLLAGVRDACAIDYLPGFEPDHAVALLAGLRDALVPLDAAPLVERLAVHVVMRDVVVIADATALEKRLATRAGLPRFVDLSDPSAGAKDATPRLADDLAARLERVFADALRRADEDVRNPIAAASERWTPRVVRVGAAGDASAFDSSAFDSSAFDSSAFNSDAYPPPPSIVGVMLGYPVVYAWDASEADIARAARTASSESLALHEAFADFDASAASDRSRAERSKICAFTVPARLSEAPETSGAIEAWTRAMAARCEASEGVWSNLAVERSLRDPGPVAL